MLTIHTLGHSTHPIERFLALLHQHGIGTLADVRSRPYSKWSPQFQRTPLSHAVEADGITYAFLGDTLGGRPEGAAFYDAWGYVNRERRSQAPDFLAGIGRLIEIASGSVTAIMCAEEDPNRCHRRMLITPALLQRDVTVLHIRGDGLVQSEEELRRATVQLPLFE